MEFKIIYLMPLILYYLYIYIASNNPVNVEGINKLLVEKNLFISRVLALIILIPNVIIRCDCTILNRVCFITISLLIINGIYICIKNNIKIL